MAISPDYRTYGSASRAAETGAVIDAGLRAYMLRVYNWMASGLVLTGVVASGIANTSLITAFYPLVETPFGMRHVAGPLAWFSILPPLPFVLLLTFSSNKLATHPAHRPF